MIGRGAISHMLKNPLYVGLIRHQNELHDGQHESIVDRGLFDAVQAALAEQGPGEAARSKSATTSLLKGIAFDGNGDRLQPAHCNKKGVRYRYYTSARRLRDAGGGSEGIRVPAGDLERLVTTAMADRLSDRNLMQQWLCEDVPVGDHPGLLKRSSELASIIAGIDSECAVLIRCLIEKLIVSKTAISIRLSASGLQQKLGIATSNSPRSEPPRRDDDRNEGGGNVDQLAVTDSMTIAISSHLLRCGKQVKLILGQTIDQPAKANAQLLEMVAKTRASPTILAPITIFSVSNFNHTGSSPVTDGLISDLVNFGKPWKLERQQIQGWDAGAWAAGSKARSNFLLSGFFAVSSVRDYRFSDISPNALQEFLVFVVAFNTGEPFRTFQARAFSQKPCVEWIQRGMTHTVSPHQVWKIDRSPWGATNKATPTNSSVLASHFSGG